MSRYWARPAPTVGEVVAAGELMRHNESARIYAYPGARLPVVCEENKRVEVSDRVIVERLRGR